MLFIIQLFKIPVYGIFVIADNRLRHLIFISCPCYVNEGILKTSEDHGNFLLLFQMYKVTPDDKRQNAVISVLVFENLM